jgi:toxin ParE1/3/4
VTVNLIIRPQAQADVDGLVAYLDDQDPGAGTRFLDDLRNIFDRLVTFPHYGPLWPTRNPTLAGLRRAISSTFPISVFYLPTKTAVEVVRVLRHSRDIPPLLNDL